jgi:hypothetical protein
MDNARATCRPDNRHNPEETVMGNRDKQRKEPKKPKQPKQPKKPTPAL